MAGKESFRIFPNKHPLGVTAASAAAPLAYWDVVGIFFVKGIPNILVYVIMRMMFMSEKRWQGTHT